MLIPLLTVGAIIAGATDQAGATGREVLVDRSRLAAPKPYLGDLAAAFVGAEVEGQPEASSYVVSGVTVPPGGWEIDAISVYFRSPATAPGGKPPSIKGRLNVVLREGRAERPRPADDPRKGRIVSVVVKPRDGFNEIRAEGLGIRLRPGEYWLGLTPVCRPDARGTRLVMRAEGHAADRFEPAVFFPEGAEAALGQPGRWNTLTEALRTTFDGEVAMRVEGRRLPRGTVAVAARPPVEAHPRILLRGVEFEPLEKVPDVAPDLTAAAASRVVVVQLRAAPDQAVCARLTELGVTRLDYIPENAYLVECSPDVRDRLAAMPEVRWVGPYHPAYKIAPGLLARGPGDGGEPGRPVPCHIRVFDQGTASRKEAVSRIERNGGVADAVRIPDPAGRSFRLMPVHPRKYRVTAELSDPMILALARCDSVSFIEPYRGDAGGGQAGGAVGEAAGAAIMTLSDVRSLFGADHVEATGGYRGRGVRGAVIDTDVRDDHVDLDSRPTLYAVPRLGGSPFHGTATAGILFGDGTGNPRARGILPQGLLVFAAAPMPSTDHYDLDTLARSITAPPYSVVFVSDATGHSEFTHYDCHSVELDEAVFDRDLIVCKAMGNSGHRTAMEGGWSKNAIVIGGADHQGSQSRDEHRPWGASSFGPASDGRIKPDLVHFASGIIAPDAATRSSYAPFSGTSCATPLTAGHVGLMLEMWADNRFGTWPRGRTVSDRRPHAATAKALLINSAAAYPFEGEQAPFSRPHQGWGVADLRRLDLLRDRLFVVDEDTPLASRQAITYRLRVVPGEAALRATLAYTDPPGSPAAGAHLVNDLDLTVTSPDGVVYRGNNGLLAGLWSGPGGRPDRTNNLENVFVSRPSAGTWTIEVAVHRLAFDQYRETPDLDCDFALVVSGVGRDPVSSDAPDHRAAGEALPEKSPR